MHAHLAQSDAVLQSALKGAGWGDPALPEVLEALGAPIYMTDAEGFVTFFTSACVTFTGRSPQVGQDRWCVTWKLYTEEGASLPHDECPMAVAIAAKRTIRGVCAVAERPDGARVTFAPFPTPILDSEGNLVGAINLLLDLTDIRQSDALKAQAVKCRQLLRGVSDPITTRALRELAAECDSKAADLDGKVLQFPAALVRS